MLVSAHDIVTGTQGKMGIATIETLSIGSSQNSPKTQDAHTYSNSKLF